MDLIIRIGVYSAISIILILGGLGIASRKTPDGLGVINGKLKEVPKSPNCISSQAEKDNKIHYMPALDFDGDIKKAKENIINIVNNMNNTVLISEEKDYLHFVFTSLIFRYKDDVEFYFDSEDNVIHFRSASRVGWQDMNGNRKRMEEITYEYYKLFEVK